MAPSEPPQAPGGTKSTSTRRASWLIVALRIGLLLAVAGAGLFAWALAARRGDASRGREARYVCPMHPEVTAEGPEECPICHMALEPQSAPKTGASTEELNAIGLKASDARRLTDYSRFSHVGTVRKHTLDRAIVAPAWFEPEGAAVALLYKDEISALEPEETATFHAAGAPAAGIEAHLAQDAPIPWDRSTSKVRFRLVVKAPLPTGEPGWLKLAKKPRTMLVLSSTAVLESPEGPYVLLYSVGDRRFVKRPIEVGKVFGDLTAIVGGLRERETVVEMNTFYIDAERRLTAEADVAAGAGP